MVSLSTPLHFANSWKKEGAGRTILSTCGKLGIPMPASRAMARMVKIGLSPSDYISRRMAVAGGGPRVSKTDDYVILQGVAGLDWLKQHCESVFEKKEAECLAAKKAPHSLFGFWRTDDGPAAVLADLDDMRPIVEFLCQPELVAMATDYIGELPVLGNICLWWSNTNSPRLGPQNIHRDMNCRRQLHIIIPLRPIDHGTGPFTFLPGGRSREVIAETGHYYGRIDDDDFAQHIEDYEWIPFTSDRGAALVMNPYACFHFGGRATTNPRFVLICSYTSKFESAEEGNGIYRLVNRSAFDDGTPMRKRLLNL